MTGLSLLHVDKSFKIKALYIVFFGSPAVCSLGIQNTVKPFIVFDNNKLLPYLSNDMQHFDKKQILWAFFVLRSVVARTDLRVY